MIIITIALAVLCCTDKDREATMRRKLLEAKAQNVKSLPFTTDSTMKEVVKYYDRHGSPNDRMTAHYLLGCVYRDLGDASRALQCYNDAVGCADTTSADCDYAIMSRIYGQMDELFSKEMQPQNQLKALDLCSKYALKARDTLMYIVAYDSKSIAYHLLNDVDSEIVISERASQMFRKHGYREYSAMSLGTIVERYLERNDTCNAGRCVRIYESESGVFDSLGNIEHGHDIFYFEKGLYLLHVNKNDSAEYYFRKLLEAGGDDINRRIAAYRGLSLLYRQKNMPDSTAKYSILGYELNDTMCMNIMNASMSKIQALYDYGHYNEVLLAKSEEARKAYVVTSTIIFLSVVLAIVLCTIIYIIKRRRREALQRQKAEYEHKIAMLRQMQSEMNLLWSENVEKQKKLIKEKQEIIRKLEKETETCRTEANLIEERLMNSDLTIRFQKLAAEAKFPSSKDWHEMREMIDEVLPGFKTTFYNGKRVLRNEEYQICILVRLHFRPLEMSNLTGETQSNITTMRKRMLKKIFDKEGKPKDFDILVSQIK